MNNCKKEQFCFKNKRFFEKKGRETRDPRFFWDFRFCGMRGCFLLELNRRGLFSVIFLHFLQKYRCVPKIGFSADISIDVSIDIFIDILIDAFIDISIDILIDISIDIFIDILTDILIDIFTGGGKQWDSHIKSNNPNRRVGKKQK